MLRRRKALTSVLLILLVLLSFRIQPQVPKLRDISNERLRRSKIVEMPPPLRISFVYWNFYEPLQDFSFATKDFISAIQVSSDLVSKISYLESTDGVYISFSCLVEPSIGMPYFPIILNLRKALTSRSLLPVSPAGVSLVPDLV